jgi:hypothetical protein
MTVLGGTVTDDLLQQIADDVQELTEKREHNEPTFTWTNKRNKKLTKHVTEVPSLLDQLRELTAEPVAEGDNGGSSRSIPESRTPEGSRAFELLLTIEAGSAWWVSVAFRQRFRAPDFERHCQCQVTLADCLRTAGPVQLAEDRVHCCTTCEHPEPLDQVVLNLRQIVGLATADGADIERIASDVASWRRRAEEVAGWRDPARQPYVRCPTCSRLGTLRVDLAERHAVCVSCRSAWSEAEGTIGLLAEHIRAERIEDDTPRAVGSA